MILMRLVTEWLDKIFFTGKAPVTSARIETIRARKGRHGPARMLPSSNVESFDGLYRNLFL